MASTEGSFTDEFQPVPLEVRDAFLQVETHLWFQQARARLSRARGQIPGVVQRMPAQADSTATDVAGLVADFNALLDKLRAAGMMEAS